jgi:hypothetical protein
MSVTTLYIDDAEVSMPAADIWPSRMRLSRAGESTLTLVRKGGPTIKPGDSLLGKKVRLEIDGSPVFAGEVVDLDHQYTASGWTPLYQCRSLRALADRVPFTDDNTLTNTAVWNLPSDDPLYLASRAGKTVGEILTDALTMAQNAAALDAMGIGGYTALTPTPTLPLLTIGDLSLLTAINPQVAQIGGDQLMSAIESYLSAAAPNHALHIQADGVIRVIDTRAAATSENTLTLGVDPVEPTPLRRSVADCYQRVEVRGQPIAEPQLLSLSNGGLVEDWAWGAYATSAEATAAWTPDDFKLDETARSEGTCTVTDTVTVELTSDPSSQTWAADDWDQSHRMGSLLLSASTIAGVTQNVYKRIVSNTAKTAGGTSTVTLESALPATGYDTYKIYGVASAASFVYRRYKIVDPDVVKSLARKFSYPFAWVFAGGTAGTVTSYPVASVLWNPAFGSGPPYNEESSPFTVDTETGHIIFTQPTYIQAGNNVPVDVRVVVAVNTGELTAVRPESGYEGTSHTVEGLARTKTITCRDWTDPINQAHMEDYAQDRLDAVKDAIVEGVIVYHGLYTPALTFGNGISVTGDGYTTGWEGLNLPIVETEVLWNDRAPSSHTTTMFLSNRRAWMSSGDFLRPSRNPGGQPIGFDGAAGNADDFTPKAARPDQQRVKAFGIDGERQNDSGTDKTQ